MFRYAGDDGTWFRMDSERVSKSNGTRSGVVEENDGTKTHAMNER
jgi:hypothetical protein